MEKITIYTDGGCTGNPGPGGWGAVILTKDERRLSGGDPSTTNNRMELTAAIKSLEYVQENHPGIASVELYTDSQYVKNGINSWMVNWKRNGWKTAAKKPVKNKDLWIELDEINQQLTVHWKWVKGHSGDKYNEICDELVAEERARFG